MIFADLKNTAIIYKSIKFMASNSELSPSKRNPNPVAEAIGKVIGTAQFIQQHNNGDRIDAVKAVVNTTSRDIQQVRENIEQSIPVQVLKTGTDVIKSWTLYQMYIRTGKPEYLNKYYGKSKPKERREVKLEESIALMCQMHRKLEGNDGAPKRALGDLAEDWEKLKSKIEPIAGEGATVSNYVMFDHKDKKHYLFYYQDDCLKTIPITIDSCEPDYFQQIFKQNTFSLPLDNDTYVKKNEDQKEQKSVKTEIAIRTIQQNLNLDPAEFSVYYISPNANNFSDRNHQQYDRDGEMYEKLYKRKATRYGELEQADRYLTTYGLMYDPQSGIKYKDEFATLKEAGIKTRMLADHGQIFAEDTPQYVQAERDLNDYSRQIYYFDLVKQYYKENPEIVDKLLTDPLYEKYKKQFWNIHLGVRGQTEEQTARAMLANVHLAFFEVNNTIESDNNNLISNSPSQVFMQDGVEFINDMTGFILKNNGLPLSDNTTQSSIKEISRLHELVKKDPLFKRNLRKEKREYLEIEAEKSFNDILYELERGEIDDKIVQIAQEYIPGFFLDEEERIKFFRAFIGNVILVHVPDEDRPTMQSTAPKTDYYREGNELLPFDEEDAVYHTVEESLRHIFNKEVLEMDPADQSAYESQVSRIYTEASTLVNFLKVNPRVPENIRKLMNLLTSEELADKVLEHVSNIDEANPEVAGKLFREGFHTFQLMAQHRIITDFVRGVESQLVFQTQDKKEVLERKFIPVWKNYDFNNIPADVLEQAINKSLQIGEHRIDYLNHKEGVVAETLKDKQSQLEIQWFWDTMDMRYLRWKKFWDVLTTFGIAADCICPLRENIFNAEVLPQY